MTRGGRYRGYPPSESSAQTIYGLFVPATDRTSSFRTHSAYVRALADLCGYTPFRRDPVVISELAARVRGAPSYQSTSVRTTFDREQVRRSLHAAWGSELLLSVTGAYAPEQLRGVSNTWVAIQAYYACYHAVQALIVSQGQPRPASHPATQRLFIATWVTPPRDLSPWSLGAIDQGYANLPPHHVVDEGVHQWVASASSIDLACKAFRTTRDEALTIAKRKERQKKHAATRKAWQEDEANRQAKGRKPRKQPQFAMPRLTPAEHAAVEGRTRAYGLLDYLYRLRIRAQYEDSTFFTEGPESPSDSQLLYMRLGGIVRSTLLLHELFIERTIGRAAFEGIVDEWIASQGSVPLNHVQDRRSLLLP